MNISQKLTRELNDPFKTFKSFEIIIAVVCILLPALLAWADTGYAGFRPSISDYVYMRHSYIFGMLLSIAALLFIFNGAVYFKNQGRFGLDNAGKWYNVILGISLLLVILLPYKEHEVPHFIFAGIFFIGNVVVIALFHKRRYRVPSLILALLTLVTIALHFLVQGVSIFAAEWLSLAVIGIHFILEATGAISLV